MVSGILGVLGVRVMSHVEEANEIESDCAITHYLEIMDVDALAKILKVAIVR